MSFAAKTVLKPISMATNGCLTSGPSLFKISCFNSFLSIPCKPVKFPNLFSLKLKGPLYRVSVLAANQEENNPFALEERETEEEEGEEEEEEGQDFKGDFNWGASENDENGDGYVAAPEGTKLYVGNLPYDVDSEKLAQIFEQAGVVETAEVIYNRDTDQSRGFGFVAMSTQEETERAVEMLNRYDVQGRPLVVNISVPKGSRPERGPRAPQSFEPSYKIYVGNLSWNVDNSRLKQVFSEYGKVVSAQVVSDRDTGRSRGFGFVTMSSESEMNDAIANLDGQSLDGRAIRVNVAEERPRRSF